MKKGVVLLAAFAVITAAKNYAGEPVVSWTAGQVVPDDTVKLYGEEHFFCAEEIGDSVWQVMQGKTYKKNPNIGRSDLCYLRLLHRDANGATRMGEMVCNRAIADKLVNIFHELYCQDYRIERMVLPDNYDADDERQMRDNNTSCFCYRMVAGSRTLSNHALGLALDLNPLYNPYVRTNRQGRHIIQPGNAVEYSDRSKGFPYKIDHSDLAYKLFTEAGFIWGGNWRTHKDYQHFEYKLNK